MAFDRQSVKSLLSSNNSQYFSKEFPIFYKNKDGKTSLDMVLDGNQLASAQLMVNYIVENQQSQYFAHLFDHCMVEMISKGIKLHGLFKSGILNHSFNYEQWPEISIDDSKIIKPYNGNIFQDLRYNYPKVYK